jgi:hypothetical protein
MEAEIVPPGSPCEPKERRVEKWRIMEASGESEVVGCLYWVE